MADTLRLKASKLRNEKRPPGRTIPPQRRLLPPDITAPKFGDLVDLALLRVLDAASLLVGTRPPRLFPTAETVFADYYTNDDWLNHGDLETEMGRMSYMLAHLPERGIPVRCLPTIRLVLSSAAVLTAWKRTLPQLRNQVAEEVRWLIRQMQGQQQWKTPPSHGKSDFIAVPVDYRTDTAVSDYAIRLWQSSLSEMALQASSGNFQQARAFLQIFAFLKDPLGGLESDFDKAVHLFAYIMTSLATVASRAPDKPLNHARRRAVVAQAAQEALFLACPLLEHISYIHFTGHQQLPYVYVLLDQLPRSEFSDPDHVLHIVEEILTADCSRTEGGGFCPMAPISVATYPALPFEQEKHRTVIIDGNHRSTAVMLLRLLAAYPALAALSSAAPEAEAEAEAGEATQVQLDVFCAAHGLGLKWKVDLADVLAALRRGNSSRRDRVAALVRSRADLVARFHHVRAIPALVVREDNFHTACLQRPALEHRPRLLLPIHQALYNDDGLGFAFPQSGQVHGRTVGFRAMPLLGDGM